MSITAVWLAVLAIAVLVVIFATSKILDNSYPGERD